MNRSFEIAKRLISRKLSMAALAALAAAPVMAAPHATTARATRPSARQVAPVPAGDTDKTLAALHDEIERSRQRLVLPGQDRPFYIQYRLLDLDETEVGARFDKLQRPPDRRPL